MNKKCVKLSGRRIGKFGYVHNIAALFDFIVKEGRIDMGICEGQFKIEQQSP